MFQKRSPRVQVALKAVLDSGDRYETVGIENLSETGAFVALNMPCDPGEEFTLIPLDEEALPELNVRVVRAVMPADTDVDAQRPRGFGLQFTVTNNERAAQLRAYCAQLRQDKAQALMAHAHQERGDHHHVAFEKETIPLAVSMKALVAPHGVREKTPAPRPAASLTPDSSAPSRTIAAPSAGAVEDPPVAALEASFFEEAHAGPIPEVSAAHSFLDLKTDVIRSRSPAVAPEPVDADDAQAGDDAFLSLEMDRVKTWLKAGLLFQLVVFVAVVGGLVLHEQAQAEKVAEQHATIVALSAQVDASQRMQNTQGAVLTAATESLGEIKHAYASQTPTVTQAVDLQRLGGTDKAALVIDRRLTNPQLTDARVDFIRTRVFRAAVAADVAGARAGLQKLDKRSLKWVVMRDDVVRCDGGTTAGHTLSAKLSGRIDNATVVPGCGKIAARGSQHDHDALVMAVADNAAVQVVSDVGIRIEGADGETTMVIADSTMRFVP